MTFGSVTPKIFDEHKIDADCLYKNYDCRFICERSLSWIEWDELSGFKRINLAGINSKTVLLEVLGQAATNLSLRHHVIKAIAGIISSRLAQSYAELCVNSWGLDKVKFRQYITQRGVLK